MINNGFKRSCGLCNSVFQAKMETIRYAMVNYAILQIFIKLYLYKKINIIKK